MATQPSSSSDPSPDPGRALFEVPPVPMCLVDGTGCLVALNRRALAFWGLEPGSVLGRPATDALGIVPADGGGDAWGTLSPPMRVRTRSEMGQTRPASVMYTALDGTTPPLGALFIIEGAPSAALSDVPEWACGTR